MRIIQSLGLSLLATSLLGCSAVTPPMQHVWAEAAEVEVRTPQGVTATTTDEFGRLELRPAPTGPVSLRVRVATGATIVTEWTTF